ncbi:hypothetical protein RE6C_05490 [Rhodopirellula europaea 6C]|uniref:Uncharacterized protein n=1 Tax=Rhodopirellula europaea 6C TaxID=1263867 RepID=M2AMA5_9BACT|nr:hypothetical protein RE6C_05490 [Rhodopirellula europaea 6C]
MNAQSINWAFAKPPTAELEGRFASKVFFDGKLALSDVDGDKFSLASGTLASLFREASRTSSPYRSTRSHF